MTCDKYIEHFLVLHADDELIGRERRAADDHVASCTPCRLKLKDERSIKAFIGHQGQIIRTPADVRLRIRAALGELAEPPFATAQRDGSRRASGRFRVAARTKELRVILPVAAALAFIIFGLAVPVHFHQQRYTPPTAAFDLATAKFDSLSRNFRTNVATAAASQGDGAFYAWVVDRDSANRAEEEAADLMEAYREINVPEEIYDFDAAGYGLYGGRIEELPDGKPVTYTLYRGEKGDILSLCMPAPDFSAPIGARYWAGTHSFYEYRGHSISLSFHPDGHFISILVSRESLADLLNDVALADAASSG
jgi:hypothetical protein